MSHMKPLGETFPIERQPGIGAAPVVRIDLRTLGAGADEAGCVPGNAAFAARAIPADQVSGELDTRLLIHDARIALSCTASVLGERAISR